MKKIIVGILLLLLFVGNKAYSVTDASLLPNAVQQFFDNNGNPLTSGTVTTYEVGTSTLKTTWKDSAGAVANTNPIRLDAGGKAIIYGEGNYRQLVKDRNGNIIWDAVTAPGGGGSTPTSVGDGNLVGTVLPWSGLVAPNQYVFGYGQEISRATFPEFYTAVTQALTVSCNSGSNTLTSVVDTTQIRIGSPVELPLCVIAGTTVTSKTGTTVILSNPATVTINSTATFFPYGNGNGSTTFNVPDLRGYAVAGRDNMGGTAASRLTSLYFNTPGLGATGGSQSHDVQLPQVLVATGVLSANSQATFTVSAVQPTITINYVVKVTPDTSTSIATGVASLNGMTGTITCGAGLLCTGNVVSIISASSPSLTTVATGWGLTGGPCTVSCTVSTAVVNPAFQYGNAVNLQLSASVASNALTVSLKANDGTDPSSVNPILIPFRNATASSGAVTWISQNSATSAIVISGATLGTNNALAFRYWVAAVNDSNIIRLCMTNTLSGSSVYTLASNGLISGISTFGSLPQTWYCNATVTNKPYTLLGYLTYDSGLTTAGLYTAIPNVLQLYGPGVKLPGDIVQVQRIQTGVVSSNSIVMPLDDTIPQITEGAEFMAQAITPSSVANPVRVSTNAFIAKSTASVVAALFQDNIANALTAMSPDASANNAMNLVVMNYMSLSNIAAGSAATFRFRAGTSSAGTTTFNGAAAARLLGGSIPSFIQVEEIMR